MNFGDILAEMKDNYRKQNLSMATSTVLPEALADDLRNRYTALMVRHTFAPGDLVVQKDSLELYMRGNYHLPVIVVEVLGDPVRETNEGRAVKEYDMLIGAVVGNDGDFVIYPVDSRRFEPWSE